MKVNQNQMTESGRSQIFKRINRVVVFCFFFACSDSAGGMTRSFIE